MDVRNDTTPLEYQHQGHHLLFDCEVDKLWCVIHDFDNWATELDEIQRAVNGWCVIMSISAHKYSLIELVFCEWNGRTTNPPKDLFRSFSVSGG